MIPERQVLAKNSLVVFNQKAGDGKAGVVAGEMRRRFGIDSVDFFNIINGNLFENDIQKIFQEVKALFILGGDGTLMSIMRWLAEHADQSTAKKLIIPLGLGGSNVIYHQFALKGGRRHIIEQILSGNYRDNQVYPFTFQIDFNQKQPLFWHAHAGFSGKVLDLIEQRRSCQGNIMRRITAVFFVLKHLNDLSGVSAMVEQNSNYSKYYQNFIDSGVITASFPFWTNHVVIPISQGVPAILHLLSDPRIIGLSKPDYYYLFLKEIINIYLGVSASPIILLHIPLTSGSVITLTQDYGPMGVDAERINGKVVKITIPKMHPADDLPTICLPILNL